MLPVLSCLLPKVSTAIKSPKTLAPASAVIATTAAKGVAVAQATPAIGIKAVHVQQLINSDMFSTEVQ
jgi:hypothetical protein